MKLQHGLAMLASVSVLASVSCKQNKEPKTSKEKVSYAIGQQIGRGIKMQEVDVDLDMMKQSIQEVIDGKESRMKPEEMQQAMMEMQQEKMEKRKKAAEENVEKGAKFLDENKAKDGVKTTESGLQYIVVKEGTGAIPTKDDTVKVHYVGKLIDGTEFDSSVKRGTPAEFPVSGVIPGWTEALLLMKEGGKRQLFIPSDLAYGATGRPGIPPNSVLVFDVELLEIVKNDDVAKAPKDAKKSKSSK